MNNPKNIKEAKKLIKKYRNITFEMIIKSRLYEYEHLTCAASRLTGFGQVSTCLLCQPLDCCAGCIYQYNTKEHHLDITFHSRHTSVRKRACVKGANRSTYIDIYGADTPKDLLVAFRARADHIEDVLKGF